jgi:hypothetical protein
LLLRCLYRLRSAVSTIFVASAISVISTISAISAISAVSVLSPMLIDVRSVYRTAKREPSLIKYVYVFAS